jgi:hypothetical protein
MALRQLSPPSPSSCGDEKRCMAGLSGWVKIPAAEPPTITPATAVRSVNVEGNTCGCSKTSERLAF